METRQTPVPSNQGSAQPDSPDPIFSFPPSASQPPPAQSFSPTPSPPRELSVHQPGEILPQGNHPIAIPTGDSDVFPPHSFRLPSLSAASISRSVSYDPGAIAMVNSLPAPSGRPCAAWTSEPSAFDAESSPVDRRNQQSVQPGFPEHQSSHPWTPLQQQDHKVVPAGPQLQLAMRWTVPDTAQSIAFALKGDIDGLKDLFSRGLASPSDVSVSRGFSLMRVGFITPVLLECALDQR